MKLKGKMFNGSDALLRADRRVRSIADNVTRFPEFHPRSVPAKEIMEALLHYLYAQNICCHLGVFSEPTWLRSSTRTIPSGCLSLCDSPVQNLLFQTVGDAESFTLEGFEFDVLDHQVTDDIVIYDLTYGEFRTRLHVLGIDSVRPCGPESNVDFVHFVWDNRKDLSCLNYAITVLPPHYLLSTS